MTDPLREPLTIAAQAAFSAEAPPVFMGAQARWVEDESPLKVIEKSRRTGITWAEAADDVTIAALRTAAGGQNVYYIGYNMDMAIEFIDACAMWARVLNQIATEIEPGSEIFDTPEGDREIKTYTIRFPESGHRIVALSSRPANLRGKQGVVVIDEAAFHDQLDELLKAALALLIWGGKVRVISTHNGDENPFNELIQDIRGGKRSGSVHRIDFRAAVDEGLYRRVCLRLNKPWDADEEVAWVESVYRYYGVAAEEELDAIPSAGAGAALPRAWIEACVADRPVLQWGQRNEFAMQPEHIRVAECADWIRAVLDPAIDTCEPDLRHYYGADFGRSGDLSCIWPIARAPDLKFRSPFLIELRNIPYEQQRQILFHLVKRLGGRFASGAHDARGNGGYLAEVAAQQFGAFRVAQVQITEGWYREHMPRLRQAFEDRLIEVPRSADVVDDLRQLRRVKGVIKVPDNARTKGADGGDRHGDTAVALAMALFAAATMDTGAIEWTPMPIRAPGFEGLHAHEDAAAQDDVRIPEPQAW